MEYLPPTRHFLPSEKEPIRDKFVAPFYRMSELYKPRSAAQDRWLRDFAGASHEIDESVVGILFDIKDWRSLRVAALMVGFRDWKQYSPWMIGRIRSTNYHDSSAMGVGVAMLALPSAVDPLREHLDLGTDEKGWLIAASVLAEIDRVNGTSHSEPYLAPGGPLELMIEEQRVRYPVVPPDELPPIGKIAQLLREAREQYS